MLDREKVIKELNRVGSDVFKKRLSMSWFDASLWQKIMQSPLVTCKQTVEQYAVFGVDGSQIYPDNHMEGIDCFLVNAGGCFLSYQQTGTAKLFSDPTVYTPATQKWPGERFSIDMVDLVREEHEFAFMLRHLPELNSKHEHGPIVGLFDGNLLFWYLETKPVEVKNYFLQHYIACLQKLYEQRLLTIGYLSASRFTDIVELVKEKIDENPVELSYGQHEVLHALLPVMTDADLLTHVLAPGQRTVVFASKDDICSAYPDELKPHFLYLHVGSEIVRIELPAWIVNDVELVDIICAVCFDQSTKGQGYPVALAEAHAQAVVQGGDRDFFYQMLYKRSLNAQANMHFSPKSFKKRVLSF